MPLLDQLAALPPGDEVIVCRVQGSHAIGTATGWPDHLPLLEVLSPRGRARQMNVAAGRATGHWLWFVHADSRLHVDTLAALNAFVDRNEDALGYFDLVFRDDGPRLTAINAWGANLRSRLFGMPFGDQGLVVRRDRFLGLGAFDETLAGGEDHAFVWRAREQHLPLRRTGARLATSARKYNEYGWLRTTLRHLGLTVRQAWPRWKRLRNATR